jgi:hypothetical protein
MVLMPLRGRALLVWLLIVTALAAATVLMLVTSRAAGIP